MEIKKVDMNIVRGRIRIACVDKVVKAAKACADGEITKAQFYAEFDQSFFKWKGNK